MFLRLRLCSVARVLYRSQKIHTNLRTSRGLSCVWSVPSQVFSRRCSSDIRRSTTETDNVFSSWIEQKIPDNFINIHLAKYPSNLYKTEQYQYALNYFVEQLKHQTAYKCGVWLVKLIECEAGDLDIVQHLENAIIEKLSKSSWSEVKVFLTVIPNLNHPNNRLEELIVKIYSNCVRIESLTSFSDLLMCITLLRHPVQVETQSALLSAISAVLHEAHDRQLVQLLIELQRLQWKDKSLVKTIYYSLNLQYNISIYYLTAILRSMRYFGIVDPYILQTLCKKLHVILQNKEDILFKQICGIINALTDLNFKDEEVLNTALKCILNSDPQQGFKSNHLFNLQVKNLFNDLAKLNHRRDIDTVLGILLHLMPVKQYKVSHQVGLLWSLSVLEMTTNTDLEHIFTEQFISQLMDEISELPDGDLYKTILFHRFLNLRGYAILELGMDLPPLDKRIVYKPVKHNIVGSEFREVLKTANVPFTKNVLMYGHSLELVVYTDKAGVPVKKQENSVHKLAVKCLSKNNTLHTETSLTLDGPTAMLGRQLHKQGYKVVWIPTSEWRTVTPPIQAEYLLQQFKNTVEKKDHNLIPHWDKK